MVTEGTIAQSDWGLNTLKFYQDLKFGNHFLLNLSATSYINLRRTNPLDYDSDLPS